MSVPISLLTRLTRLIGLQFCGFPPSFPGFDIIIISRCFHFYKCGCSSRILLKSFFSLTSIYTSDSSCSINFDILSHLNAFLMLSFFMSSFLLLLLLFLSVVRWVVVCLFPMLLLRFISRIVCRFLDQYLYFVHCSVLLRSCFSSFFWWYAIVCSYSCLFLPISLLSLHPLFCQFLRRFFAPVISLRWRLFLLLCFPGVLLRISSSSCHIYVASVFLNSSRFGLVLVLFCGLWFFH